MRDIPGLSVMGLANAVNADRSTTGERLRQLARRGIVEKDATGRWRLTEEAEERAEDDVPVTMAAPEPNPGAQSRWVKPLSTYERRETTVVEGLRYG